MSDALRPGEPLGGEYTDSELPLSAELTKEEAEEVEEVLEAEEEAGLDADEVDIEIIEIDDGTDR
jgi:hypothetical protein